MYLTVGSPLLLWFIEVSGLKVIREPGNKWLQANYIVFLTLINMTVGTKIVSLTETIIHQNIAAKQ